MATQRLMMQYAMHPLSDDERVTCESMLSQEPSSRVLVMPTHHINEFGDMMGFRFTCNRFFIAWLENPRGLSLHLQQVFFFAWECL